MPVASAKPAMRLVFPTPGLPSSSIAFFSCRARNTRMALQAVVAAPKLKCEPFDDLSVLEVSIQRGCRPHVVPLPSSAKRDFAFSHSWKLGSVKLGRLLR